MFKDKWSSVFEVFGSLEVKVRHGIDLFSDEIKIISTQRKKIFYADKGFIEIANSENVCKLYVNKKSTYKYYSVSA